MQQVYPFFIILSIVALLISALLICAYTKQKKQKTHLVVYAVTLLLLPILMTTGMLLNSDKLIAFASFFPIGLFLIIAHAELLARFKKCSYIVSAKYVSFTKNSRRGVSQYIPTFSYNYNGENITTNSFLYYSKRTFKKLFEDSGTYDIFINPAIPNQCVDKRRFPINTVIGLILWALVLIFGSAVVISI